MQTIEAIYQNGVFKPLHDVQVAENERVTLTLQTTTKEAALAWMKWRREGLGTITTSILSRIDGGGLGILGLNALLRGFIGKLINNGYRH